MNIFLYIVSIIFLELSINIIINRLTPFFSKKAKQNEIIAGEIGLVKADKMTYGMFFFPTIIVNIAGLIILIFPKLVTDILGFNFIATIIIWWTAMIFDNIILYFLSITAIYNGIEILVKMPFVKPISFKINEIIYFSKTRNLTIKTKDKKIILLRVLSGTDSLRNYLTEKLGI